MENKKPFPSFEDFNHWYLNDWLNTDMGAEELYAYFSQFQYEVYPKVGEEYEFDCEHGKENGNLVGFIFEPISGGKYLQAVEIRPASRPTREEVIESINNKLENGTDKIIFDRELVEQFLQILKG